MASPTSLARLAEALKATLTAGRSILSRPMPAPTALAYIDNPDWPAEYRTLYVSLFGEVFNPKPVGHIVERIALRAETTPKGEFTYRGEPSPFVVGLDRPLPLATTPTGNLLVGDYATGVIYEIFYPGE